MGYGKEYLRERSKHLVAARKWAITAGTGTLALGLFASKLMQILKGSTQMMDYAHIALLGMTGWLIFSWIWSSQRELDLLFEWLDPKQYEPPSTILETVLILSFGVLLAGLLFAAKDPRWYAIVFTAYSFADVLANRKVQSEVGDAISKSKERLEEDLQQEYLAKNACLYANGLETLEDYFVRRRHDLRTFVTLVASTLGLLVSVMWWITASNILGFVSYVTFILILVGSQITVWCWRLERDVKIRPIKAKLNELTRLNKETVESNSD